MTLLDHAFWSLTLTWVCSLTLGLFVLWKKPHEQVSITFAIFNLCVAVWSAGQSRIILTKDPNIAMTLSWIMHIGIPFIAPAYYHFTIALIGIQNNRRTAIKVVYGFATIFALLIWSSLFLIQPQPKYYLANFAMPGPLYGIVFLPIWLSVVGVALIELFLSWRHSFGAKRNQLMYVLVAFVIGFSGGVSSFAWVFGYDPYPWTPYGTYGTALYPLLISYAILKHRLMDISVVIRKSVVYSILVGCITATYFVFVFAAEKVLRGVIGYHEWAPSLLAAFVIAFSFNPIKNWVQAFVDRYFFRGTQVSIAAENARLRGEIRQSEKLKAVSLFASGMAHEIKNPLASIKTFAEYLPEKYDDPAFRQKFSRIVVHEVLRIHSIVQRLLDFARPAQAEFESIDMSILMEETLDFLQADIVTKHLQLVTHLQSHGTVLGDPSQLKQVLLNVLLNAIEATCAEGTITISVESVSGYVTTTVQDTGRGMSPEALCRAGEPFYTTKPEGTGLGLAVVHGIVEQHGGRLDIESVEGRGTIVQLQLPMNRCTSAGEVL